MRRGIQYAVLCLWAVLFFSCNSTNEKKEEGKLTYGTKLSKKTQSERTKVLSPEGELAGFSVPEGFIVELVASEEEGIVNPIDITFDDTGRLWTQTASMYPLDPVSDIQWKDLQKLIEDPEAQQKNPNFKKILDLYQGKTKGDDKILVISNLYGKGNAKVAIWADGLAIPQSIMPYKNGSYVAQGSELFFLEDTNGDGKSNKRTPFFTGFGYTDTHTMSHVLVRGPGDWIHFSQGALNKGEVKSLMSNAKTRLDYSKIARFSLDGKKMELVSSGLNNIWGFQLRGNGQWYGMEANDLGYSVVPMEIGTGFPGIGKERLRPYQPWMPTLHSFRIGGTGLSAVAFADDDEGSFPEEWKDVAFMANPITNTINAVRVVRKSDGSVAAEHLPDFLTSEDDWFRPVNMEFGPDGALYVADWYNKIVSHNEVPTTNPDRDKSHGRIWRIRHKSQKKREIPNFYKIKTADLPKYLASPSLWAKNASWHQISDRPIEETKKLAKALVAMASDRGQNESTRIHALWSLEGIQHYEQKLIVDLLKSPSENLKREAVRSLQSFSLDAATIAQLLKNSLDDKNPMVRSQVLRTLGTLDTANTEIIGMLVSACKPPLDGNEMGGSYERSFERYLARKSLENYPNELSKFIVTPQASNYQVPNLIWASQALPKNEREAVFVDLWKKSDTRELDEPTFIIVAGMLENKKVYDLVRPLFDQNAKAESYVTMALENQAQVQSDKLTTLLEKPIRYLLKNKERSKQIVGLEAVGKLKIAGMRNDILPIIKEKSSEETLQKGMVALENRPSENKDVFNELAKDEDFSTQLRTKAVSVLAKADGNEAEKILTDWMPDLDEMDQRYVTKTLSNSREGVNLLKELLQKGTISSQAFDIFSAEAVFQTDKADSVGKKLYDEVTERVEKEKKEFDSKLERFMAIAEKGGGDAVKGEGLFQTCILCHRVGDKGHDIAPALDGSATRENEALLTAILNPDAAMESGYAVYKIVKKDGNTMEGYMANQDDRGTTLAFMGGSEQFVQKSDIASEGFLVGRSFMPKGLIDNYSDDQVADLLAYIGSLN